MVHVCKVFCIVQMVDGEELVNPIFQSFPPDIMMVSNKFREVLNSLPEKKERINVGGIHFAVSVNPYLPTVMDDGTEIHGFLKDSRGNIFYLVDTTKKKEENGL